MRTTLLFVQCFIGSLAAAQNAYSFEQLFSVYTPITNGNECTFDGDGLYQVPGLEGQSFLLYDTSFTIGAGATLSIGEYGFLRMDNATSLVILDGLFTFMEPIDTTSKVLFSLTGSAGEHRFITEWRNWKLTNGPEGNFVNFQLMLDQESGVAEVRIGPNSGGGVLFTDVSGPNCGIFYAPHSFSQCYGKLWVEGNGNTPALDSLPNFDFDALLSFPDPNKTFRFIPRVSGTSIEETGEQSHLEHHIRDGVLTIRSLNGSAGSIELIDTAGRSVASDVLRNGSLEIPVSHLPAGIYLLRSELLRTAVPLRLP